MAAEGQSVRLRTPLGQIRTKAQTAIMATELHMETLAANQPRPKTRTQEEATPPLPSKGQAADSVEV